MGSKTVLKTHSIQKLNTILKLRMASKEVDMLPDDDFPNVSDHFNENPSNDVTPEKANNSFNEKTIENLLKCLQPKLKVTKNASPLLQELLRIYSVELISRAGEQAIKEGSSGVSQEHLEKVLPQFLLDFN